MRSTLLCALAIIAPLTAHATVYTFTTLNVPGTDSGSLFKTQAHGINNAGQIVGEYPANGVSLQGFLFDSASGAYTPISNPASPTTPTVAEAINDNGQIVGFIPFTRFIDRMFLRDPATGGFTIFTPSQFLFDAMAGGINDAGQIVGTIYNGSVSIPGVTSYLRSADGTTTFIADPTAATSFLPGTTILTDINNAGLATGYSKKGLSIDSSFSFESFIFDSKTGSFDHFSDPDGTTTLAQALNDVGQVAGLYFSGQDTKSFVFDIASNVFTMLADPDGAITSIAGINDRGQIVGNYVDSAGTSHAFLANPVATAVPEPASMVLLGAGLFGLGLIRPRRLKPD